MHLVLLVVLMVLSPEPNNEKYLGPLLVISALWGLGTALNKTGVGSELAVCAPYVPGLPQRVTSVGVNLPLYVPALIGLLYAEEKERLDFVYTIYHWWQAIAIFMVYLWSALPMRVSDIV